MTPTTDRDYRQRILRVLVHIQNHLDDPLRLEDLAQVACFSPYHFHRIFGGMVGESLMEHIRRLRLERAAQHCLHTTQPVTRIAFDAGYETHEAFTRAFKQRFGLSPSRYRSEQRLERWPSAPSQIHFAAGSIAGFVSPWQGADPMNVTVKHFDPQRVAFIRHIGPYAEVGASWQQLMAYAGQHGMLGPATRCLGIFHDDPGVTAPDKLRADACLVVHDDFQPDGDIGVQTVAGGEYAVYRHAGPYDQLEQAYNRLCGQWLPTSGRELRSAPCFEVYLNNPQTTPPDQLLTDIHLPLV